jgi:hypothetical protein
MVAKMKPPYPVLFRPYSYATITEHCAEQIAQFLAEAHRHSGREARYRLERAYGAYIGWRALVAEYADPAAFYADDRRLEALLKQANAANVVQETDR